MYLKLITQEEIEDALLQEGLVPTDDVTENGRIWKIDDKIIRVPNYKTPRPYWVVNDLLSMAGLRQIAADRTMD